MLRSSMTFLIFFAITSVQILTFDELIKIQAGYKDARQKIEQVTGESAAIDNIYYLIVPEESRL